MSRLHLHVRAILFVTAGLLLIGAYTAATMPVAIFPRLTIPRIVVVAEGGDAPAQSVLVTVTRPLESALSTVPNLQLLQSQTTRGTVGFTLTLSWGADLPTALQMVNSRIADVRAGLPAGLSLSAQILNPTIFPILDYSLTSRTRSLAELRQLALYTLRPRLGRVPGVARVIVNGGDTLEYQVVVSPERLAAHHLAVSQVDDALQKANSISAVGNFDDHYLRHLVLVNGTLDGADAIRQVVVDVKDRVPVTVADIADVEEAIQRQTVVATGKGQPAVLLNIVRQPDGNTIAVARDVKNALAAVRPLLPPDVSLTAFYDQSQLVQESENSVVESIVVGGILALVVLVLFLGSARTAITALSLLPLSLIITFAVMRLIGLDFDIMTLGGLAIALGMVIDDSIVVVEHMYHHLEMGTPRERAIPEAVREITPAMISSSGASIVTFLPLLFLPGVTGNFFSALALTMVATLAVSLVLSLVVCPTIALRVLPRHVKKKGALEMRAIDRDLVDADVLNGDPISADGPTAHVLVDAAVAATHAAHTGLFYRTCRWCLRKRYLILFLLIPLAIGAAVLGERLTTGFMPEFDEGSFVIDYHMPTGTSLMETDRTLRQVESILAAEPGIESWSRLTGAQSGTGLEITPQNQGDIDVLLKHGNRPDVDDIIADVRSKISAAVPNLQTDYAQILSDLIGDLAGSPSPIEVKIFGPDMATLRPVAHEVGERISAIKGVVDESDGIVDSGPEAEVRVHPVRAAEVGLSTDTITAASGAALEGAEVGAVLKGDLLEPIRVKYPGPAEPQISTEMLGSMPILTPAGQPVPLSSVASIVVHPGQPDLNRENQRLVVSVTARLEGIDLGAAVRLARKKLADLPLPPGCSIEYGGLYKSQQQSFRDLSIVLALTILLAVAVLILTFRSFRVATALLAAAVLSLSGVIAGLYLTGTPLNISSFTGAIMVVGIVVENGVLLFDEVQRLQRLGIALPLPDLLAAAASARLRPILMMKCAAVLTLLPLSFGIGAGAAMQKPLAIAVIGGVGLSVIFTLIVAPVVYLSLSDLERYFKPGRSAAPTHSGSG